jgi:hypothetical protein
MINETSRFRTVGQSRPRSQLTSKKDLNYTLPGKFCRASGHDHFKVRGHLVSLIYILCRTALLSMETILILLPTRRCLSSGQTRSTQNQEDEIPVEPPP